MDENPATQVDIQQANKKKESNYLVWITLGGFLVFLAFGILLVWVFCGGLEEWKDTDSENSVSRVALLLGIPDTVAVVGKMFSYHVPDSAFQGTILSMHTRQAGSASLPGWLFFDEVSFTLLGVPTPKDLGAFMIEVDVFSSGEKSVSTSFLIQVRQASQIAENKLYSTDTQRSMACDWDEQTISASVLLDANMETLSPSDRVSILSKWSNHLSLSMNSLTLGPKPEGIFEKLSDRKILTAGPGDASPSSTNKGVELSWVIGCGEFHQRQEIEAILMRNIERGYIREVLGFHVIGWYATETSPLNGRVVSSIRKKRQVQGFQTPLATPTLSTTKPTAIPTFSEVTVEPTISASLPVTSSVFMSSIPQNLTSSSVPRMTTTSTVVTSINVTSPVTSLNVTDSLPSVTENTTAGFSTESNYTTQDIPESTPALPTDISSTEGIVTSPPPTLEVTNSSVNNSEVTTTELPESGNATTMSILNTTVTSIETSSITTDTGLPTSLNTTVIYTTQSAFNGTTLGNNITTLEVPENVTGDSNMTLTKTTEDFNVTGLRPTTQMTMSPTSATGNITSEITGVTSTPVNVSLTTDGGTNATREYNITTHVPINATTESMGNQTSTTEGLTSTVDVTEVTMFSNATTVTFNATAASTFNATTMTTFNATVTTFNATTMTFNATDYTTLVSSSATTQVPTNVTDAATNATISSGLTTNLPINITTDNNVTTDYQTNLTTLSNTTDMTTASTTSITETETNATLTTNTTTDVPLNVTGKETNYTTLSEIEPTTDSTTVENVTTPVVTLQPTTVSPENITSPVSNITTQEPDITTVIGNITTVEPTANTTTTETSVIVSDQSTMETSSVSEPTSTAQLNNSTLSETTVTGGVVSTKTGSTAPPQTTQTVPLPTEPGVPPYVNSSIPPVQTYLGVYFNHLVPEYTFLDDVYGNTRNLSLHLDRLLEDNTVADIDPEYWVQFNSDSQVLYGLPLQYDLSTSEVDRILLKATNPRDLSTNLTIVMNISGTNVKNISFIFSVEILQDRLRLANNDSIPYTTDEVISIVNTIGQYYGDEDATWVTLIDIINNDDLSVTVKWTNNSISKAECQNDTIGDLYSRIAEHGDLNDMVKYFLPSYSIQSTSVQYLGVCTGQGTGDFDSTSDFPIYLAIFIPLLIVLIIVIVVICVFCCLHKKGSKAGRYIPDDEKPIYSKNRKPIFIEGELEMDDPKKPRKPTIMDADQEPPYAYSNPSYSGPDSRRPPPPYVSDPDIQDAGDPTDSYPEEPVGYVGEMQLPQDYQRYSRRPPPVYRLPPPYIDGPGYSHI